MVFYSAKTRGFYNTDIHGENMPADVVEISDELHAELIAGQSTRLIVPGVDGLPVLVDRPTESREVASARALSEIRKQRAAILSALDGIAGRASRSGDSATSQAADEAILALLDITKLPALLQAGTYDEMKAIVLSQYRQIADAAPAVVQSAFLDVAE